MHCFQFNKPAENELANVVEYSNYYSGVRGYFKLFLSALMFEYLIWLPEGRVVYDVISHRNNFANGFVKNPNLFDSYVYKERKIKITVPFLLSRKKLLAFLMSKVLIVDKGAREIILFNQWGFFEYILRKTHSKIVSLSIHSYIASDIKSWDREAKLNYSMDMKYFRIYAPSILRGSDFLNNILGQKTFDNNRVVFYEVKPVFKPSRYISYPLIYMSLMNFITSGCRILYLVFCRKVTVVPHPKNKIFVFLLNRIFKKKVELSSVILCDELTSASVILEVEKSGGRLLCRKNLT